MSITKDKKNWMEILPRGTSKVIHALIEAKITERSILRILKGEIEDNHGVIAIAAKISKEHQKTQEQLSKTYTLLKLKKSQPLKTK